MSKSASAVSALVSDAEPPPHLPSPSCIMQFVGLSQEAEASEAVGVLFHSVAIAQLYVETSSENSLERCRLGKKGGR